MILLQYHQQRITFTNNYYQLRISSNMEKKCLYRVGKLSPTLPMPSGVILNQNIEI
jgi:hypothetical protein